MIDLYHFNIVSSILHVLSFDEILWWLLGIGIIEIFVQVFH